MVLVMQTLFPVRREYLKQHLGGFGTQNGLLHDIICTCYICTCYMILYVRVTYVRVT
jgi:hypothetical protein